jgi:phosphoadenosine phosphosulfate reductase
MALIRRQKRGRPMPLEAPFPPASARVAALNARYRHHAAIAVLRHALQDPMLGPLAMVSSFGAESAVLLHMLAQIDRSLPVLFIDTELLFPETLDYQLQLTHLLGLTAVQRLRPTAAQLAQTDPKGTLHQTDSDACCALRKTQPLQAALAPFDAWITGRKRFQGQTRADLQFFETDAAGRIKINPLAHWPPEDVAEYRRNNRLPPHPLVARGYPSIGCAPCTSPVAQGEDPRAGRWRGQGKTECGIHIINGKFQRKGTAE